MKEATNYTLSVYHRSCSISSNNERHPVTKTFTPLHYASLYLSKFQFFPFKLHPTTLHYSLICLNPI